MRSALALAAVTVTVVVLLSGCVQQGSEVTPPPEPSTTPIFASDEEALAAATEAYEAYLAMSDLIAKEGGVNPERIAPYVTEEWLVQSVEFFGTLNESDRRQVGESALIDTKLQQYFEEGNDRATVVMYACLDYSRVALLDQGGIDTIPPESPDKLSVEATLQATNGELRLAGNEPWTSSEFC